MKTTRRTVLFGLAGVGATAAAGTLAEAAILTGKGIGPKMTAPMIWHGDALYSQHRQLMLDSINYVVEQKQILIDDREMWPLDYAVLLEKPRFEIEATKMTWSAGSGYIEEPGLTCNVYEGDVFVGALAVVSTEGMRSPGLKPYYVRRCRGSVSSLNKLLGSERAVLDMSWLQEA